jgi:hypothetical protein
MRTNPADLALAESNAPPPVPAKVRIAVLLDSTAPAPWAAAVIEALRRNPDVQVQAIVIAHEPSKPEPSPSLLFRCYSILDSLRVPGGKGRNGASSGLPILPVIPLELTSEGQRLNSRALSKLKELDSDILLNLAVRHSVRELTEATKFGIWEFRSRGLPLHMNPYLGFWEVYQNEPITKVSLAAVSPSGEEKEIAESGLRTHGNSISINRAQALRCAPILVRYGVNWLRRQAPEQRLNHRPHQEAQTNGHPRSPRDPELVLFGLKNCASILKGRATTRGRKLQWSIGITSSAPANLNSRHLASARWLTPDSSRFFADPFPIEHRGRKYIFFEELPFSSQRGRIAVIELLPDGTLTTPRTVLETGFHLSYPFVFEEQGKLYMLPEQSSTDRIALYEAVSFPDVWKQTKVLVEGFAGIDSSLLQHRDRWWLFTSLGEHGNQDNNLHVFHAKSLWDRFKPHPLNPVKMDISSSRMAGKLFFDGEKLLRPAQNCSSRYGGSVVFHEVTRLSEKHYAERALREVLPAPESPFGVGFHTVNSAGSFTMVDGLRVLDAP